MWFSLTRSGFNSPWGSSPRMAGQGLTASRGPFLFPPHSQAKQAAAGSSPSPSSIGFNSPWGSSPRMAGQGLTASRGPFLFPPHSQAKQAAAGSSLPIVDRVQFPVGELFLDPAAPELMVQVTTCCCRPGPGSIPRGGARLEWPGMASLPPVAHSFFLPTPKPSRQQQAQAPPHRRSGSIPRGGALFGSRSA